MATTPIFEPDNPNELLRGWLLHAHKGRDRHDLAARRSDHQRYLIGIPATITAAIVGTSTFAALQKTLIQRSRLSSAVLQSSPPFCRAFRRSSIWAPAPSATESRAPSTRP